MKRIIFLFIGSLFICSCGNNIKNVTLAGTEMEPAIKKGTILSYDTNINETSLQRFDVVIYYNSKIKKLACHRIIGLSSESVDLGANLAIINTKPLVYPKEIPPPNGLLCSEGVKFPFSVPEHSFFLLADRPMTLAPDSRIVGPVNMRDIKGKVLYQRPLTFPSPFDIPERKPGEITADEQRLLDELEKGEKSIPEMKKQRGLEYK